MGELIPLVVILIFGSQMSTSASCVGGVFIAEKCLTFSTEKLSWNDAKESCSAQNGRLATLNDPQAFKSYVASNYDGEKFWLGASDITNEGKWVWLNGQPLGDRFPWHYGEPNAAFVNEDCLVLWGDALSDAPCTRPYNYVCEKDVNECDQSNGGCAHKCENTIGSFNCKCNSGYLLDVDGISCNDVNECAQNKGGCDHSCQNTDGSFNCKCNPGYILDVNGKSCKDVNECAQKKGGCDHSCQNTDGSFNCKCNSGYLLDVNGKSCKAVCPKGVFSLGKGRSKNLRLFTDSKRSWEASKSKCESEGLLLAKPQNPVEVRKFILDSCGDYFIWVGARGTGSAFGKGSVKWIHGNWERFLHDDDTFWNEVPSGYKSNTNHCLRLLTTSPYYKPYAMYSCTLLGYALCEVKGQED